jgi:hypothetical protein
MKLGAPLTSHTPIRCLLMPRGGIPPAVRRRSRLALTQSEREDISRGIASGSSIREIARHLDRAASTVGREVTRHKSGNCWTQNCRGLQILRLSSNNCNSSRTKGWLSRTEA